MSVNPLFGNKKRSSSMLYSVDQTRLSTPTSGFQGSSARGRNANHAATFPPNKRHRGMGAKIPQKNEDPFGDNEDFTADDLEEIDILATQALTQGLEPAASSKNTETAVVLGTRVKGSFSDNLKGRENKSLNVTCSSAEKGTTGNAMGRIKDVDTFGFEVLQAQHDELKRKVQEMQENLLMKNGEIKVLRDTLRLTESDLDQQKRAHVILEKEKAQLLSEKEKELSKKIQALESELHFKDAEMNELRTKLQNCERVAKPSTPVASKLSPKQKTTGIPKLEGCVSPQTGKNSFPTTATFAAEMSPKHCSQGAQQLFLAASTKTDDKGVQTRCVKEEEDLENNSFCTSIIRQKTQMKTRMKGSVLLSTLFKESIAPGSLGLCHLLSLSPEAMSGTIGQQTCFSSISTGKLSPRSIGSGNGTPHSLTECWSLAVTGLSMLTLEQGQPEQDTCMSWPDQLCTLPGAVHLLPLVQYYISRYCQMLQTIEKSGRSPPKSRSLYSSSSEGSTVTSTENLQALEDFALTALGVLFHLVFHSKDVVCSLLSPNPSTDVKHVQTGGTGKTQISSYIQNDTKPGPSKLNEELTAPQELVQDDQSLHPLFRKLLQLLDPSVISTARQRETILCQSLKVLVKLSENSTIELLPRFQFLLSNSVLLRCLGRDSPCSAVCLSVRLMAVFTDHSQLTTFLCSHSENCLLLHLCTYTTYRPDKSASDRQWFQLEIEVVRFFTKLYTYNSGSCTVVMDSECQCSNEVVKTLTIVLHRHWLNVRKSERNLGLLGYSAVQFLQDTVLLLHCLSQKDKNFTEHCLDVLHQYDQVMPGLKAIFRRIPDLKESEEIALEELCPPEPDVEDQEIDTGL